MPYFSHPPSWCMCVVWWNFRIGTKKMWHRKNVAEKWWSWKAHYSRAQFMCTYESKRSFLSSHTRSKQLFETTESGEQHNMKSKPRSSFVTEGAQWNVCYRSHLYSHHKRKMGERKIERVSEREGEKRTINAKDSKTFWLVVIKKKNETNHNQF